MSTVTTHGDQSCTDGESRTHLLTHLAAAIRAHGGTALLALGETDHPVLYVRKDGRRIPVVVVQGVHGGRWFIWGREAYADVRQVELAAEYLTAPPTRPNLVTQGRRYLQAV